MNVSIQREELNGVHEFVLRIEGQRLGYLEYSRPDVGVLFIDYVEVAPDLRGKGFARGLVEAALEFARQSDLRVVPNCGYARSVMDRMAAEGRT